MGGPGIKVDRIWGGIIMTAYVIFGAHKKVERSKATNKDRKQGGMLRLTWRREVKLEH